MNLHRSEKTPDWEKEYEGNLPGYAKIAQSVAKKTKGVVTPGNIVSAVGLGLTLSGAKDVANNQNAKGAVKIILGRCQDILDGWIADKTKTKSATGEAVDATFDKIGMAATLFALGKQDIVPKPRLSKFALQNTVNVVSSTIAKQQGIELHPSKHGKITTVLQWVSVGASVVGANFDKQERPIISKSVDLIADITAVSANSLGALVSMDYLQTALNGEQTNQDEHTQSAT